MRMSEAGVFRRHGFSAGRAEWREGLKRRQVYEDLVILKEMVGSFLVF